MIRFTIAILLLSSVSAWPMTDPAGDAVTNAGIAASNNSGSDLLELRIEETEERLDFYLTTEDWRAALVPLMDTASILVPFSYGEAHYALDIAAYNAPASPIERAVRVELLADFEEQYGVGREVKELEWDRTGTEIHTWFEKTDIRDHNGAPLVAGRSLTGIYVSSLQGHIGDISGDDYAVTMDRMPDTGSLDYLLTQGEVQSDELQLISLTPLRWSNGGATVFAFQPRVLALENETVTFAAEQVPPGWTVHVPEPTNVLDGNVTVYLETNDRHMHDGEETFTLVASKNDVSARLKLGVYYPEIPMPAGHHATLYLHGRPVVDASVDDQAFSAVRGLAGEGVGRFSMNTDETVAPDEGPIPGNYAFEDGGAWVWPVLLDPALRTGLNFTTGPAPIEFTTNSDPIGQAGTFTGELVFLGPKTPRSQHAPLGGHVLASFSTPGILGESIGVEWSNWNLTDTSYRPGVQLGMNLFFHPDVGLDAPLTSPPMQGPWTPFLVGGKMTLPLGEYHDDVTIPLTEEQEAAIAELGAPAPEAEEAPTTGLLSILAMFACVVSFQRRSRS